MMKVREFFFLVVIGLCLLELTKWLSLTTSQNLPCRGWMAASPSPVSFYWGEDSTLGDPKKPLTVELPIPALLPFLTNLTPRHSRVPLKKDAGSLTIRNHSSFTRPCTDSIKTAQGIVSANIRRTVKPLHVKGEKRSPCPSHSPEHSPTGGTVRMPFSEHARVILTSVALLIHR